MAVIALKTEPKCKLCTHPERESIDRLLEMRSQREKDENGVLVNGDYVLTQLAAWGVNNPTRENITNHWKKHVQRVSGAAASQLEEQQGKALDDLLAILDSEDYPDTMDGQLNRLWDLGLAEIRRRLLRGDNSGISADQMRWIAAERTRRQHNETQADLLTALGQGIARAEITAVKAVVSARPAIPANAGNGEPAEIEDAEFEEAPDGS